MTCIEIRNERTGYDRQQARESAAQYGRKAMTVGDLREYLEDFADETLIFISNDNGYTYGVITAQQISEEDYDE